MRHYNFIILLFFIFTNICACDLIVFSYNRPMQLQAYLESLFFYVKNLASVSIIYRADSPYDNAYEQLINKFNLFKFVKQNSTNFRNLVLRALQLGNSGYVMFAVDDIIVTDKIDLLVCTKALSKYNAYGFYLRLGKNIDYCYMQNRYSGIAQLMALEGNFFKWQFNSGKGDWNFPNTLDMTIYNLKDVLELLKKISFNNPNTLEGQWALYSNLNKVGLCFSHSKIINIPVNIVQSTWKNNRNMNMYTPQDLLERFYNGQKINWKKYHKINNISAHIEVNLEFIFA